MSILDFYKPEKIEDNLNDYYNGLEKTLHIFNEHINTLFEDRKYCESIIDDPNKNEQEKRIAKNSITGMTSSASNDIYENQLSKIFGITNIETKHGWDGNDENKNEPYEYKPTKVTNDKYFEATVSIRDDNMNIIHHKKNKTKYNNYEANFVIAIINKNTSEFICIYKFKEHILYADRIEKYYSAKERKVSRWCYSTNIKKCIEFSKKYCDKYYYWHNPNFL
jgi:hypothetical protein